MSNSVRGIAPGFLLLPAREYEWELVRKVEIRVPNSGSLSEIVAKSRAAEEIKFSGEDEFLLFEDNLLLLWSVVRVLFADTKYPDLQDNECLNVVAMELLPEEVVLHGEVIRSK